MFLFEKKTGEWIVKRTKQNIIGKAGKIDKNLVKLNNEPHCLS